MGLFSKKDKAKPGFFKKLFSSSDNAVPEEVISPPKPAAMPVAAEVPPPKAESFVPPPAPLAESIETQEEPDFIVKPLPKVTSPKGSAKQTLSGTSSTSRGRRGRAPAVCEEPEVVSIVVETRAKLDTSRLRTALSNLQGVVRGADALVAACSYDEPLLTSAAALVEEAGRLQHTSYIALAHRPNVVALADFFVDTVNMLDANATRLTVDHARLLRRLRGVVREGREAAETLTHPGWLMRMARGEGVAGEFAHLQTTALSLLRAEGMDACTRASFDGRTRRLTESHFPDMGFAVRKALKTLGGGALEAGVLKLRQNDGEQAALARQLEVPEDAVAAEAALDPFFSADSMKIVEEGPARDADAAKVFKEYCTTSHDAVTADGFEALMTHMGLLERRPEEDRPAAARAALVAADSDYDGALDYTEFRAFYGRYPITSVRHHLRMTASLEIEHRVREVFNAFATFGASKPATPRTGGATTPRAAGGSFTPRAGSVTSPRAAGTPTKAAAGVDGLDSSRFAKLCRDCGLVSWGMTASHVDTIFHATKPRAARRLDFDHFLAAMVLVADRRGQSLAQVARAIAEAGGPALRGTRATFVSLHDDPSKTRGSITERPDTGPGTLDLRLLVDRSKEATPPALPRPRGAVPAKQEPTRPESPKLATRWRVANGGPCTPGRGANLEAVEALAAAKAAALASPRGPRVSFGRTMTPKVTPKRGAAAATASPAKTATPAAKKETKGSSGSTSAAKQLFAAESEPVVFKPEPIAVPAAVEEEEPIIEESTPVFEAPASPVAAAEPEEDTEADAEPAPAPAPAFSDPFASMTSGITMVSLGSMQPMRSMADVTPVKEEKTEEVEEEPVVAPTPFYTPAPVAEANEEESSEEEPASLVRSASYAAMMAALYGSSDSTAMSTPVEVKEVDVAGAPSFGSPLDLPAAAIEEAVAAAEASGEVQEADVETIVGEASLDVGEVEEAAEAAVVLHSEVSMSQSESDAEGKTVEVEAL